MKVADGGPLERIITDLLSDNGRAGRLAGMKELDFPTLLGSVVDGSASPVKGRLDRGGIEALMELVRVQMNRSVMDAFSESGEDSAPFAGAPLSPLPQVGVDGGGESKFQRSLPGGAPGRFEGDFEGVISRASETYGVDRGLIVSVIRAESGFDPNATSPKGAMGLMQLMPGTARGLGVSDPYDPEQNVMAGTRFLRFLLDRYDGDVQRALAAYNWGPGNLERGGNLPEETRTYIARVMDGCRGG